MITRLKKILRKLFTSDVPYLKGTETVIYSTSSIINASGNPENIVLGNFCHIKGELLLFGHGGKIEMGDYCYLGFNSRIWSAKQINIGNRVLIAHNCNIFDNDTHPLDPELRHKQFKDIITSGQPHDIDLKEEEIIIEDDVLIGANSTILKGVALGKACIIGAGSVVTKDVPPYTVVVGNPARIVRQLPIGLG